MMAAEVSGVGVGIAIVACEVPFPYLPLIGVGIWGVGKFIEFIGKRVNSGNCEKVGDFIAKVGLNVIPGVFLVRRALPIFKELLISSYISYYHNNYKNSYVSLKNGKNVGSTEQIYKLLTYRHC